MKMRKQKSTEYSRSPIQLKWLTCSSCPEQVKVEEAVVEVMCWRCAIAKTEPPTVRQEPVKKTGPHHPKGWHLMKQFVDLEGNVFEMGIEKPELKGTLKPTPIKPKKSMAQKELEAEKKAAKLVKLHKKKQELKKEHGSGTQSLVESTLSTER
jgi:hypothetical protein